MVGPADYTIVCMSIRLVLVVVLPLVSLTNYNKMLYYIIMKARWTLLQICRLLFRYVDCVPTCM
jgi:hypothetical protein